MLHRIKLIDIELSQPLTTVRQLTGFQKLKALVRWRGVPIGFVECPVQDDYCSATALAQAILDDHQWPILSQALQAQLSHSVSATELELARMLDLQLPTCKEPSPLVTVAICTHDPTVDLRLCLDTCNQLDYPHLDCVLVDYAVSESTEHLIRTEYPRIRYIPESRCGLNWARNRAALEAKGEIIAYVDDHSAVDSEWVRTLVTHFAESPEIMVITGLVVLAAPDNEYQRRFGDYGSFTLGFKRKWFQTGRGKSLPKDLVANPGRMGTDLNMAFRRAVFEQVGYFDPALTMNPVLDGAGALDLFCRVLKSGHVILYEPAAITRYQAIEDSAALKAHYSRAGSTAVHLLSNALRYTDERKTALSIGLWWIRTRILQQLVLIAPGRNRLSRDLALAEISGSIASVLGYFSAQKGVAQIERKEGSLAPVAQHSYTRIQSEKGDRQHRTAVRTVELTRLVEALTDVTDYERTRVIVTWQGSGIGQVYVWNHQRIISASRLRDAIIGELGYRLFDPDQHLSGEYLWASLRISLLQRFVTQSSNSPLLDTLSLRTTLVEDIDVSIVICTCDRPDDLRNCLEGVVRQDTTRPFEIIVVDNRPLSSLTTSVVSEFPQVKLLGESRPGADYARNKGISCSQGEIVVMLDDDTTVPSNWLENLLAPFERSEVMAVTGNILPIELEHASQRLFESYGDGGLGRGFERFERGSDWFSSKEAVRTWLLGGTANVACRACLFADPQIGLLDEALGAGMPSGSGEDIYLFYKILKAGYTIAYEPTAFVWHKHRESMSALRYQLYSYSKGHVAYHLTLLLQEQDWRSLKHTFIVLPVWHIKRIIQKLTGKSRYPISLVLLEAMGNIAGPWSLLRSHQRVRQLGRSLPYVPVSERSSIVSSTAP